MATSAPGSDCGTNASLTQTGGTHTGSVEAAAVAPAACTPSAPAGARNTTTGAATSIGLVTDTSLANAQAGSISGLGGKEGATLNNATTSNVTATGDATAQTGAVPDGATVGSAPASAMGAKTDNTVIDLSKVTVSIGGVNEAPITVTNENTRNIHDAASASATTGAAGTGAPSVTGAAPAAVTTSNADTAVTPTAVTGDATTGDPATAAATSAAPASTETVPAPASCTGHTAETNITGSAEKTVSGPAPSGQPIEIGISQRASATNTGSTTGVLSRAEPAPVSGPAPATTIATGGESNGATAQGLSADNTVLNTAIVDVSIGGNNYAPINIAVKTVTTIVNAAKAVVETAAGGGGEAGGGDASGVGARAANTISLDGTAAVEIAGDNHNPITIILDISAELWNKGLALLGLGQGTSAPSGASATGLEVENLLKLLGRASVTIGGSNYAPIDITILLQNLIYNDGVATAASAGDAASEALADAAEKVREATSGAATCATLLSTAGIVNGQAASVKLADDTVRRQVLAGNAHVVDVHGYGTARCSTGDVVGSGDNVASGDVTVEGGGTVLTVLTTQVSDSSATTLPGSPSDSAPGTPGGGNGGNGGNGGDGGNGTGSTVGEGRTAQVVVAVTTKPVKVAGKNTGGKRNQNSETWEWVVVWEPLYVIYPSNDRKPKVAATADVIDTETTTSMAGSYRRPLEVVTPVVREGAGLDLISQIQLAALALLGFLLLALLKRRLQAAEARKAALRAPKLQVFEGGVEAAAE